MIYYILYIIHYILYIIYHILYIILYISHFVTFCWSNAHLITIHLPFLMVKSPFVG